MSPSIDRIRPVLGYTPDNIMLVCWHYNCAKSEYGLEDLLVLSTAIVSKHGLVGGRSESRKSAAAIEG